MYMLCAHMKWKRHEFHTNNVRNKLHTRTDAQRIENLISISSWNAAGNSLANNKNDCTTMRENRMIWMRDGWRTTINHSESFVESPFIIISCVNWRVDDDDDGRFLRRFSIGRAFHTFISPIETNKVRHIHAEMINSVNSCRSNDFVGSIFRRTKFSLIRIWNCHETLIAILINQFDWTLFTFRMRSAHIKWWLVLDSKFKTVMLFHPQQPVQSNATEFIIANCIVHKWSHFRFNRLNWSFVRAVWVVKVHQQSILFILYPIQYRLGRHSLSQFSRELCSSKEQRNVPRTEPSKT